MGLLNQAVNFIANVDYSTLILKGVVKTAQVAITVGYEVIKWSCQ